MAERVRVTVNSGGVVIVGEPRDGIDVQGAEVTVSDGDVEIRGRSSKCTVRLPSGTDVVVGTTSGNVTLRGILGAVSVTTVSASVDAEDVASIDARTVSGRLTVEESRGDVRLKTKSAKVRVGRAAGDVRISNRSGRIEVDEAQGAVALKTVSGSIEAHVTGRADARVEAVSGSITVTVPPGTRPSIQYRSLSGKRRTKVEEGDDLRI